MAGAAPTDRGIDIGSPAQRLLADLRSGCATINSSLHHAQPHRDEPSSRSTQPTRGRHVGPARFPRAGPRVAGPGHHSSGSRTARPAGDARIDGSDMRVGVAGATGNLGTSVLVQPLAAIVA